MQDVGLVERNQAKDLLTSSDDKIDARHLVDFDMKPYTLQHTQFDPSRRLPISIIHSQEHVSPEAGVILVRYCCPFLKRALEKRTSFTQSSLAHALGDIVMEEKEADLMA